jgi:outer membrane protein assembly factor BamE
MSLNRLRLQLVALAAAIAFVPACVSRNQGRSGLFEPYRIDLPQGNYVTKEMLDQVRPGFTREQVRLVLGTPLLEGMFRDDRWDYVYRYTHASGQFELRRVRLKFKDNRVVDIDSDALPAREDVTDPALPGHRPGTTAKPAAAASADAGKPAAGGADAPAAGTGGTKQ